MTPSRSRGRVGLGFVFPRAVSIMARERMAVWALLAATFAIRAVHPGQPIVENYVGRQIPTAMVARNIERNWDFFHPELDTAPFPNLFLVEPPIYALFVVLVRPLVGSELEATGRLVSAAATALGAWGLYGLARRREGVTVALLALASFAAFPVMVRYGRAFQPDALMVGFVLAGLRAWDEYQATGDRRWATLGGFVLSLGLALKITSAWALLPFLAIVVRLPLAFRLGLAAAMLAPASSWYLHAWGEVGNRGVGSLASSDNATLWIRAMSPSAWLRFATIESMTRGLVIRSFTPIGFALATLGLFFSGRLDRVWQAWGLGCALSIAGLAAKWHHGYYWMVVAPLAAVGVGRGLEWVAGGWFGSADPTSRVGPSNFSERVGVQGPRRGPDEAVLRKYGTMMLGSLFLSVCVFQSASTFRTPAEWRSLSEAARAINAIVPSAVPLIAPEALLYQVDRRGLRLEFSPEAMRRAAGEWGATLPEPDRPLALVEFYRGRTDVGWTGWDHPRPGQYFDEVSRRQFVADSGPDSDDPRRRAWRQAIRTRPNTTIRVDRPELLIAELH